MEKGKLIVIEGTDCSGKETQSKLLVQALQEAGKRAVCLSFPMYETPTGRIWGGPFLGKPEIGPCWFEEGYINVDPKVACLYTAADRKYNIKRINQLLEDGYYVILDRYTSSNMAHQGSKIDDAEERFYMYQWIDKLEYWLLELPKPDQTIFLHVPYMFSCQLRKNRKLTDQAEINTEHLKRAEKAYVELSELYHWDVVDCVKEGTLRLISDIHQEILTIIL